MRDTRYKIRAILFDLGETLLSFGDFNITRLFRQGARLSYDFLKSQGQTVGNFEYYCWRNLIALRIRRWLSHLTGRDFDALALLKKVGTRKGIKLDQQQWEHLAWLWYEPLGRIAQAEPNIVETLTALKKSGLKLGIVSNTFVNRCCLEKNLKQFGILDFFTVRLYSYEFGFRKPDARIFKAAAERIGEPAENILFVGDRMREDIEAAARIGMKAVLKVGPANTGKKIPQGTWKINKLAELPSLIEKINSV
ncbi:MAG: HAD family hydrolase [Sedimentisphaerales bacterium]